CYAMLLKKFPDSGLAPDALLALAELSFSAGDIDQALKYYESIAKKYPTAKAYDYVVYKIGWCYFNKSSFETAAEKFAAVIKSSQEKGASGDKAALALEREARHDLSQTYARFGSPKKAKEYFKKAAGEANVASMLLALGDAYSGQGSYPDAIATYQQA